MPPRIPYPLLITANSTRGTCIVENLTQYDGDNPANNKIIVDLDSNKKAHPDLANMKATYANNDKIAVTVTGIRSGYVLHTVNTSKGTAKIPITQTSADYTTGSVGL